ncbi:related to transcriptional activator Mut3p [Fusarium proliferatum]|nr:related to transcriptional activator Mut3p [Fusarium proliferatum]
MTCHYGERRGRGRGKSKQYIKTLEERLKNVEVALKGSPAVNLDSLPLAWPEEITSTIIHAQKNNINPERKVFAPLPLTEYILHLIPHALEDMYEAQSLFSTDDVLKLFNEQYSAGPSNCHANPTRWATLNALLATGIQWKADNKAIKDLYPLSWAYFKNASSIFTEIVMHADGIESCQALIAMALLMRGTADARAFTALLSAAAHAGHSVGLQLEDIHGSNSVIDVERRKRLFWTIYVLRCNASLNFDLPAPSEEVYTELPSQGLVTDAGLSTDLLRHMSSLAQVQSRISRCSSPGSSISKNCDKMIQDLVELDIDLESWRTELPPDIQPTALDQVDNLGIIQLHFAYYASTWKLYTAMGKLYSVPLTLIEREQPNLHLSTLLPTHSARATISLLQGLYSQPLASLWQMICYPMCAVLILLTAVLNGPGDSEVPLNVESIRKFIVFLQTFQDREECDLNSLIEFCSKLYDVASFAQRSSTDLLNQSEDDTQGVWGQYADLRIRLSGSQDPMLLAQGLLTNMPLLGAKATEVFSSTIAEAREDGFTRLVPNVLKPSSFNFFAKQ